MREYKTLNEEINRIRKLSGINTTIEESSLSRIFEHLSKHDIAMITAFRKENINCIDDKKNTKSIITKEENLKRNKKLLASLLKLDYSITAIDGSEVENFGMENEKEFKENSFLVVNLYDDKEFINNIIKLGQYFCQDSVLLKQKEEENAYLFGTNNFYFPGLNQRKDLGRYKPGIESQFMSRIKGRPFHFEQYDNCNIGARLIITDECKDILEEILKK